ncbi:MAG TPA: FtsK/SpoIIIE domain-containing protein [Gaiellaceae bacterium]|nr:FtsK/SpoIIIE domain-containing protein [Gaiellaceae bacterium]
MAKNRSSSELRLVVVSPDGRRDVAVEAAPDVLGRELLEALELDRASVAGHTLPPDVPVSELGLRWGDELNAAANGHAATLPVAELRVEGGPESGRVEPLAPGTHAVGRDSAISIADPALSGRHLVLTIAADGSATVADAGSRNGTTLDGTPLEPGTPVSLPQGALIRAGRTLIGVTKPHPPAERPVGRGGLVQVNRPPRQRRPPQPTRRPFAAPPNEPQRARLPLGASLIPLALGVGLFLLTHLPTMLFFSLLSPVMAVTTYMEDRRSGRKGFQARSREYRESTTALRAELESERRAELAARRAAAPSPAELLDRATRHEPTLWERRPGDDDFLRLRLGTADQPSLLSVEIEAGGSKELHGEAESVASYFATAPAVPLTVGLTGANTVGVAGPREHVDGLVRCLLAQAAALHSPVELEIAAALGPDAEGEWDWLKWLPHTEPTRLGTGPVAARSVIDEVARTVTSRRGDQASALGAQQTRIPHVLLVIDETVAPERSLVGNVLSGADSGVTTIWLARERRDLPGESTIVVQLDEATARASVIDSASGFEHNDVSADELSAGRARELALALAPLRDPGGSRSRSIPPRVSLFDLLGIEAPSAAWVGSRWDDARDLGATIGSTAGGLLSVDLRLDGPHGLVAGTTGAGKSELLQTLLASLAVSHAPNRLSFLLVDYKGGAAFKECVKLPHTVGLVTDLDAHLTRRALSSLNAELQRRERILRDADAKDLADLERRDPESAPASLLIVIDEFATLAKEVPDFVEGIVDVAQRGRSLGVHLILATQRPGGVVSENIRANTNLRIALRVNESAESSDVIGAGDAARIPRERPGRCFVRTGHGELTELQAAYVGGASAHATEQHPVVVRPFRMGEQWERAETVQAEATDLTQLVAAAQAAADERGIERGASPWLDPLPAALPLESVQPAIGTIDEPQRQSQRPLEVDLEAEGSLLVYGAGGSGKTTLLRTLAAALASQSSPDELHVYGLDFATRGLTPLEALPHVGAVIGGEDQERVERLFSMLRATLEKRKALFAHAGAFTLSQYPETLPRILVLLDGYGGFASAFERVNLGELVDLLPRLVADGRPLGVHFAITADRRGAVPNSLAGIIPTKFVLRMADEDEFAALGVEPRAVRGAQLPPGRGFLPGGTEFQVARDPDLKPLAGSANVPAIEPLPTSVERASMPKADEWHAAIGIADSELAAAQIDLSERHFLVVGPYRSGRSTALQTVVESLAAATPGVDLHLLAPRRSPLTELGCWASVATGAECEDATSRLASLAGPAIVVIDDGEELAESLGAPALEQLVRRGRDVPLRVIAAAERQAAQRAFSGWLRELRKEEHAILLDPDPDVDGDIVGTRLPRRSRPVFPPGRGYLVERGSVELVQVAS